MAETDSDSKDSYDEEEEEEEIYLPRTITILNKKNTILKSARSRLPEKQKAIYAGRQDEKATKNSPPGPPCTGYLSHSSVRFLSQVHNGRGLDDQSLYCGVGALHSKF